jgi:hypothetical protein
LEGPGPGAYDFKPRIINESQGKSLSPKGRDTTGINNTPGPNIYSPSDLHTSKKSPSFGIGTSRRPTEVPKGL